MYDQGIGKHCEVTTCKQKDWLAVRCKYCEKNFCNQHSSIDTHQCPNFQQQCNQVYICPLCNQKIQINPYLSLDQSFNVHEAMECSQYYEVKQVTTCPVKGCKATLTEVNKYQCCHCHKQVCLKHRMVQNHQCI